jgi:hypothetical protein
MARFNFSARYTAAMAECGGHCPIEAGALGPLANRECRNGPLPFDQIAPRRVAAGLKGTGRYSPCRARRHRSACIRGLHEGRARSS